jgi:hypothetical protein
MLTGIFFGALSIIERSVSLLVYMLRLCSFLCLLLVMAQQDDSLMAATLELRISEVEIQLLQLISQLEGAKKNVQNWVDANSSLSLSAAQARAETQSMGRGLGGALLGAKYRAARRKDAASHNAHIARNVAAKRAEFKQGKQNAQEFVRQIQSQIAVLKGELKDIKAQKKEVAFHKKASSLAFQSSSKFLVLLEKLNEAYQIGLLTQEEYEEKRKKIIEQI